MARHRIFQGNMLGEHDDGMDDYDSADFGSYEEHCLSPTSAQYIFHRNVNAAQFQQGSVPEEDEEGEHFDDGYRDDTVFEFDDVLSSRGPSKSANAMPKQKKPTQQNEKTKKFQAKKNDASTAAASGVKNLKITDKSSSRGASASPSRTVRAEPEILSPKIRNRERPTGGKAAINLIVIGHVDAGKSTLMGHLLWQLGKVNQKTLHKYKQESQKVGKGSFAFAWVLDESSEERSRGVTMDIAKTRFETPNRQIVLLDAPGHRDFIPNMISGATQADAAILVANATKGEFETGFDLGGQTREHTMLVRSLGVSQLAVVVNKLDTVDWSVERFEEVKAMLQAFLKQAGFSKVDFVPVSGLGGINLSETPEEGHPLRKWYNGPTLVEVIDGFEPPIRSTDKPLRFCISNVFKGITGGLTVEGKVETGSVEKGDRIIIMPNEEMGQVKNVSGEDEGGMDAHPIAFAGDQCLVTLQGVTDPSTVNSGHVMCHADSKCKVASKLEARLVLFNVAVPLIPGFPVTLHTQSACESAHVSALLTQLDKSSGEVIKRKPRCLPKNSSGIVEISIDKPVCIEVYSDFKELGRITLRSAGQTLAAGVVTKVIS